VLYRSAFSIFAAHRQVDVASKHGMKSCSVAEGHKERGPDPAPALLDNLRPAGGYGQSMTKDLVSL
jgi:hypothetical protein